MKQFAWSFLAISIIFLLSEKGYSFLQRTNLPGKDLVGATDQLVVNVINPNNPGPTTPPSPPSGGSSSGGINSDSTVHVSGRAYPYSRVTLLKDGTVAVSSVAGGDATFDFSINGLSSGSYIFTIYGSDKNGLRSASMSFPVVLTSGAVTSINGIFLSPTLDADKTTVKQGDTISFFGTSVPSSTVMIAVNSTSTNFAHTNTKPDGSYFYSFDTSVLNIGEHSAKTKDSVNTDISEYSSLIIFTVGETNLNKPKSIQLSGDLNADRFINIVDFSIMAYWFQRPLSGKGFDADLNHDGRVDLIDFSILASHWTG